MRTNDAQLQADRRHAAELARERRAMKYEKKNMPWEWSIREWNNQVRITVRHYLHNVAQFRAANKD